MRGVWGATDATPGRKDFEIPKISQSPFRGSEAFFLFLVSIMGRLPNEQLCRLSWPADKLAAVVTDCAMEAWYHPSIA